MGNKKTSEEYIREVGIINPNIEVLGIYVNNYTNILHRCRIDGHKWMAKPTNILSGYGCPKCGGSKKKNTEDYKCELQIINPNIEILGEYINSHTKILHKCKIDGCEWYATPTHVLNGTGCPMCGRISQIQKRKKTHEEYIKQVNAVNPNIEVVGEYINRKTKITHKCKLCDNEWETIPYNILSGQGCPKCNVSHGENDIEKYLKNHNILYISQHKFDNCRNKKPLPFDFYLPDYNMCIEYDGIQHFEPTDFAGNGELWATELLERTKHNDEIKNKYCKENNIKLLRIRYYENIENILNNIFGNAIKKS